MAIGLDNLIFSQTLSYIFKPGLIHGGKIFCGSLILLNLPKLRLTEKQDFKMRNQ